MYLCVMWNRLSSFVCVKWEFVVIFYLFVACGFFACSVLVAKWISREIKYVLIC